MAVFRCKMCGGTIEFSPGATVGVCEYCGTKQTLPRLDDDRRVNLYDRANHFRRNNDFDKASNLYEQILNEDYTDAEAYWSLVLCRYGIEYVEDPATHKRVPTVNRAQFTSVFDDDNYKSAMKYADMAQRQLYEEEAEAINGIQKGILAISQKEDPFDVFICYKEADDHGRRTPDSVLANELYHQLVQEGFKVFYARITLEDKLGTAYEPYIFAALNSAKVMVVLGTKPEYFNAVWVRNEWSRFLALVRMGGGKKVLIPAYRDMDPYDLPEEFSHLQALDMSRLGFMQDLIRGIKKIIGTGSAKQMPVKETVIVNSGVAASTAPLLRRMFLFLEDGEWDRADEFSEQVLNQDPENARAYLGKLMVDLNVSRQEDLAKQEQTFDENGNYRKAVRFGDAALASELQGYIDAINDRNEQKRLTGLYNRAAMLMDSARTESAYKAAAEAFKAISGFEDADSKAAQCLDLARDSRLEILYREAAEMMKKASTEAEYKAASEKFRALAGYKDSAIMEVKCLEQARNSRNEEIYRQGRSLMEKKSIAGYEQAIQQFGKIPGYKDTEKQTAACQNAIEEIKAQEERERLEKERRAEEKRIAAEQKKAKTKTVGKKAIYGIAGLTILAIALIVLLILPGKKQKEAGTVEEPVQETVVEDSIYNETHKLVALKDAEIGDIVLFGQYEQDNDESNGKEDIEWLVLDKQDGKLLVISRYALDSKPYNADYTQITWETCTRRNWLNGTFLNAAFSAEEQKGILSTTVPADKNPSYGTDPGSSTTDKVFLLSITEANKYFTSDSARQCRGTAYCYARGAYKADNGNCWWWLRSPGSNSSSVADVYSDGSVNYIGHFVNFDRDAVRPAMWISTDGEVNQATVAEQNNTINNGTIYDGTHKLVELNNAEVGDFVLFGHYEQDNDTSNGKEDIEWLVLDKQDGKLFVISKYALDSQPYNTAYNTSITWEKCSLRAWLNKSFLNEAFSKTEQGKIPVTSVSADKNHAYNVDPGNDTKDKVFLLSIDEVKKYLPYVAERKCVPTDYAVAQNAHTEGKIIAGGKAACRWRLRTPGTGVNGSASRNAAYVGFDGSISTQGYDVNLDTYAIRPAMWIEVGANEKAVSEPSTAGTNTDAAGKYELLKDAKVGDYIKFGMYEQDNDTTNGKEEIEWLVIDKKDGKLLVISRYALDCKPYNTKSAKITWERSSLCSWLNNKFTKASFTDKERAIICAGIVDNTKNKVFLLSFSEANEYFLSDKERICEPTQYAADHGVSLYTDGFATSYCLWWLRSSEGSIGDKSAAVLGRPGLKYNDELPVNSDHVAVRPAMWIEVGA